MSRTETEKAERVHRKIRTKGAPESKDAEFLVSLFAGLGVFTLLTGLVLVSIGGWPWFASFLQGQASGWAQALGGVATLLAAYQMGRTQIDADRVLEMERNREKDIRSIVAVDALLEDVEAHLEALWDQVYTQKVQFIVMTEYHTERIAECAERIRAVDPFVLPSPRLIVNVSRIPRSLINLHDALTKYQDLLNGSNFQELKRQGVTLANSLSLARGMVVSVRKQCNVALKADDEPGRSA
ncbi:hypothetical protein [Variovorax atrisoli]|uniref:hypothetical protein n=1 Tax=Variovorax atrisoli TaxID=3394203 RepID=UPI00403FC99E